MSARPKAGVVMAISAAPPHGVVFVERAAHLRNHPGQIAFPGGAADPADGGDLRVTALRELHEELGVTSDRITIVGVLEELAQRVGRFEVTPFVGILAPHTPLTIDPAETAAVFTVPLATILAPGAIRSGTIPVGEEQVPSLIFEHGERVVWGLTGRILQSFVEFWETDRDELRSRIEAALEPG